MKCLSLSVCVCVCLSLCVCVCVCVCEINQCSLTDGSGISQVILVDRNVALKLKQK